MRRFGGLSVCGSLVLTFVGPANRPARRQTPLEPAKFFPRKMFAVRSIGLLLCSGEERPAAIHAVFRQKVLSLLEEKRRQESLVRFESRHHRESDHLSLSELVILLCFFVRCLSVRGTCSHDRRNAPTSCAPGANRFHTALKSRKILRHGSELSTGSAVLL